MARSWFQWVMLDAVLTALATVAQAPGCLAGDESFFAEQLYPMMETAECDRCHNDNGVASGDSA